MESWSRSKFFETARGRRKNMRFWLRDEKLVGVTGAGNTQARGKKLKGEVGETWTLEDRYDFVFNGPWKGKTSDKYR